MSSALRSFAVRKEGLTRFVKPDSPTYTISGEGALLFPFSYNNGVLDITYEGNSFKSLMVDISGVPPSPDQEGPGGETDTAVRIMSGPYLATSLGSNFKDYIRAWRAATIDSGSPIEVYIPPQLLKVQAADRAVTAFAYDTYNVGTQPPASDNFITGNTLNKFSTTYIFKTPLTFTIVESSVIKYITFQSHIEQE